ncbi:Proteasome endopeptidase complex [Mycena kentingensis (nom. inval.)]|nr:Proteasome endopeptidase complex [Mycena kentingensis (nom. inval.)]
MSFTNLYYKRVRTRPSLKTPRDSLNSPKTAGTSKPCFICYKPTTTVLATINTVDFLYTCDLHLQDPGFASESVQTPPPSTPTVSQEDVGKAIAQWEDRQKRKKEKEEEEKKKETKDDKDANKHDPKTDKADTKTDTTKLSSPPPYGAASPKPAGASHQKYVLHRDIFSLRVAEHGKRRQTAQAKDVAHTLGRISGNLACLWLVLVLAPLDAMNKNPFLPQQQGSYQPPLPPGPQAGQPDYSGYWQQQPPLPPQAPAYNQQWNAAQPPRPPAEQSSLYANYGYGTQHANNNNNNWRPPQQQQPHHFHPPLPAQPPPPPPGYNPYQPTAGYPQPYVPQAQPMAAAPFVPHPPPQQPFFPQQPHQMSQLPPSGPMQQQRPPVHHTPPHQLPPAKRQRFDGPGTQNHRGPPPQQPQFQPPTGPMQAAMFSGPQRGGAGGNHGPQSGSGRGTHAGRGSGPGGRGSRGGAFNANRGGGMSGRGGRGGAGGGASFSAAGASNGPGRGGGSTGQLRGHGSRGNFGNSHNRRGGGSFTGGGSFQNSSGSFRGGRNNAANSGRNRNDGGNSTFGARDGPSNASYGSGKKDENRRTLTDFKIIGLEIRELHWTWGSVPSSVKLEPEELSVPANDAPEDKLAVSSAPDGVKNVPDVAPPPSRMRIYFHTPVTAVDSHPIPNNASFSLDALPSDSRKGKRKKIESDDGDDDERREPPPPPGLNDDRSSVAASVAPSVAETASEADWLMAAISGEADGDSHEPGEGHEDFDGYGATDAEEEQDPDGIFSRASMDVSELPDAGDGHDQSSPPPDGDPLAPSSANLPAADIAPPVASAPLEPPNDSVSSPSLSTLVSSSVDDASASKTADDLASSGDDSRPSTPVAEAPAVTLTTASLSAAPTLLSLDNPPANALVGEPTVVISQDTHDEDPSHELEATQIDEPPPSQTVSSTSTTNGDPAQLPKLEVKSTQVPAANRLSISYEGGNRRLVFDAEIVEGMTLYRKEGRAEVRMNLAGNGETGFKGVYMETLSEVTKSYHPVESSPSQTDFPPFSQAATPLVVTLVVYLDIVRPLSEPKWVKTGDIPEWLKSLFGRMFWFAGDAAESWEKKIVVSDPDPPPTLTTVLEGWASSSGAGNLVERQRFVKTHLCEMENVMEILLRLVRGNQPTPLASQTGSPLTGPLLSAIAPGSIHGGLQTPVSLAVLAMFRMTVEYASKAGGDKGKEEVDRSTGELASYQQKMFRIDDHVGIAIAGLTSDARVLSNFMRQQAMSSRMIFNRPVPVNRLVSAIADKAQVNTQEYGRRPYGVGFLVIGQDQSGPHLYEFSPSGNSYEYYAMSIGARSQSAKTYLEKHFKTFDDCSLEDLVRHGLHALRETLQQDKELNINNTSIGILGPAAAHETGVAAAGSFRILDGEKVEVFLQSMIPKETEAPASAAPEAGASAAGDEDVQMEG